MTNYTDSALYATSPDAMAAQEMGSSTRIARPEWDSNPYVRTREDQGEIVFQQIRHLMEDGHSQVLTREHAAQIAQYAIKLLS